MLLVPADGPADPDVAPCVGEPDADGAPSSPFSFRSPDSSGSGDPGRLLRGASPGPGTTTRSASRTAPPSRAPTSMLDPHTTNVTSAPRRST